MSRSDLGFVLVDCGRIKKKDCFKKESLPPARKQVEGGGGGGGGDETHIQALSHP